MSAQRDRSPTPVSLFTGYLGAGKTTLLNRLLHSRDSSGIAVIVNEFGEVGLDHILIEQSDENVVLLDSGCLCCTIRGDIDSTFADLWQREDEGTIPPITRFVIETTGLADPVPVLHLMIAHPLLRAKLRLDGVICVVDTVNGLQTLRTHDEAVRQVAVADRIILTKADLLDPQDHRLTDLQMALQILNPTAQPLLAADPAVINNLVDVGLYDPRTKSVDVQRWLGPSSDSEPHTISSCTRSDEDDHHHHHDHSHGVEQFTLIHDAPIPIAILDGFLDLLQATNGPHLLRMKGVICLAEQPEQPLVIHGVQQVMHPPASLPAWPTEDHRSKLVFITHNCPKSTIERLFGAFLGQIAPDTADAEALRNNPLAISGYTAD